PNPGGLMALIIGGGIFSLGNSLSTPSLTSLASKSVGQSEQGSVMGVLQSSGSLARAVGPSMAAFLIHSASVQTGADGVGYHMSDHSLFVTFWTAAVIMFLTFLLAVYFARVHARDFSEATAETA
ncbi:MAG: MFS transporter, partial [Pyrinomonadaceae bacterium]